MDIVWNIIYDPCSEHFVLAQFNLFSDLVSKEYCQIRNLVNLSPSPFTLCHLSFICRKFNLPRLTVFVDLEGKKHACVYIVEATGHTCNTQLTPRLYWFRIGKIPFVPNNLTSYFAIKLTNVKSERFSISCKLYCLTGEIYCWSGARLCLSNICCYRLVEKCSDSGTCIFTFKDFLFCALLCRCFHNQRYSTFHLTFIYLVKKRHVQI